MRLRYALYWVLGACLLQHPGIAEESPKVGGLEQATRSVFCTMTSKAPKVDGLLDDACWKAAVVQSHFFCHESQAPSRQRTEFQWKANFTRTDTNRGELSTWSVIEKGGFDQPDCFGALEAPLDLVPKTKPFTLALPKPRRSGWKLVLDPDRAIPEIYEGNNEVALDALPATDYSKGWE